MAMIQRCGSAARRMLKATEQRLSFSPSSSSSSLSSLSSSSMTSSPILCGRGDKRTKKGKIFKGSYGNARPKKEKKIERIKDRVEVPSVKSGGCVENKWELKRFGISRPSPGIKSLYEKIENAGLYV